MRNRRASGRSATRSRGRSRRRFPGRASTGRTRLLLGASPDWYKSRAYRSRVVHEPRIVLAEFGLNVPDQKRILVHDSTAELRWLVVPERPAGTDGWSEDALARLVTRDSMIGTGLAREAEAA